MFLAVLPRSYVCTVLGGRVTVIYLRTVKGRCKRGEVGRCIE